MGRNWVLIAIVSLAIGGCGQQGDGRMRESRNQFHFVMETKMRDLDRSIDTLSDDGVARASALRGDYDALRTRLTALNAASDEEWPEARDSMEVHYRVVRARFDEARRAQVYVHSDRTAPIDTVQATTTGSAHTK